MKNLIVFVSLASTLVGLPVGSAELESAGGVSTASGVEEQKTELDAGGAIAERATDIVEAKIDEYMKRFGCALGQYKNGTRYCKAVVSVGKTPVDPKFMDYREIAFEKALYEIYGDFVLYEFGRDIQAVSHQEVDDDSSGTEEPSAAFKAAVTGMRKKVAVLDEARLDQALEEAGVDPSLYDGKGLQEKRTIYSNTFMRRSLQRAFGSAAGIQVVDTVEGYDKAGDYAIGVIAKLSNANREVISCIARKKFPNVNRKGISVNEYMDKVSLVDSFGCRLFFDENGKPALVSFGQAGYVPQNDSRRDERHRKTAYSLAEGKANAFMTDMLGLNLALRNSSETGNLVTENVVFTEDKGEVEQVREVIDDFIKRTAKEAKGRAEASMAGRSVVCKKIVSHPKSNQKVAVCAVMWSFDTLARIDERYNSQNKMSQPAYHPDGKSGVRSGGAIDAGLDW